MDYNVNVTTAGTYTVGFRVASSAGGGQVQLRSGATLLGSAPIGTTGGWQSWTTVTTTVNLSAGQQTLRVYAAAGGFNINWIEFVASSNSGNLALGKPATASSVENSSLPASNAVDASPTTRWSSAFSDPQWIYVDLGQNYAINRVKLTWEAAYGRDYQVQVSTNASTWTTIRTVTGNTTLVNDLTGLSGNGRYVRINGTARGTAYGYSLFGFEVYGASAIARVGIDETFELEVYPNPVHNALIIEGMSNGATVIVSKADGLFVLKTKLENGVLDVRNLSEGVYTISIIEGKNKKVTKFIKN